MKTKYCIGFFAALFLAVSVLGIGYQLSYRYVVDRQQASVTSERQDVQSITTKGAAEKNEGYYLAELHGYVAVYLSDQTTIFEFTDIPVDELPKEIQNQLGDMKYVETLDELYAFLENYSS